MLKGYVKEPEQIDHVSDTMKRRLNNLHLHICLCVFVYCSYVMETHDPRVLSINMGSLTSCSTDVSADKRAEHFLGVGEARVA